MARKLAFLDGGFNYDCLWEDGTSCGGEERGMIRLRAKKTGTSN